MNESSTNYYVHEGESRKWRLVCSRAGSRAAPSCSTCPWPSPTPCSSWSDRDAYGLCSAAVPQPCRTDCLYPDLDSRRMFWRSLVIQAWFLGKCVQLGEAIVWKDENWLNEHSKTLRFFLRKRHTSDMTGSSADIFRRGFESSELLRGRGEEGRQSAFPADISFVKEE